MEIYSIFHDYASINSSISQYQGDIFSDFCFGGKMTKAGSMLSVLGLLMAAMLACSMPLSPLPTATITLPPQTKTPEAPPQGGTSSLITVTPQAAVTNTPQPTSQVVQIVSTATTNPQNCNIAAFVADITYPDDTPVTGGTSFEKKWRLRNAGSCTWTSGYRLVFVSGDGMGGAGSVPITNGTVPPGGMVDVSITLTAPVSSGTYRGNYKLQAADGTLFGIDAAGNVFYVRIVVGGQNNAPYGGGEENEDMEIPELTRTMKLTSPYMQGDDVMKLQTKLLARGYTVIGTADGIFGKKTDTAVRQFQSDQGLIVDGIVGAKTWKALWY
jgi:hypothetical protein